MKRNFIVVLFFCVALNSYSQNVIGLVAEHLKQRESKEWKYYYCYDTYTPAFQYVSRNYYGFPEPIWERLRFAVSRDSIPYIDSLMVSLGKNLTSKSVKDDISSCAHLKRGRLISEEKAQEIFSEKRDLDTTYYVKWYQFKKRMNKRALRNIFICFFSSPIQIGDCIIVEVIQKRNSHAWDLYFYYYFPKTNELIEQFVNQD